MTITDVALTDFTAKVSDMINSYNVKSGYAKTSVVTYETGKRYARLVLSDGPGSRSAYGFVDLTTGDLLKSDGWKSPAKGKRGNIFDANPLSGCTPYGMVYAR